MDRSEKPDRTALFEEAEALFGELGIVPNEPSIDAADAQTRPADEKEEREMPPRETK